MIPLHSEQIYYKSGLFKKSIAISYSQCYCTIIVFFIHLNHMHITLGENLVSVKYFNTFQVANKMHSAHV